MRPSPGEVASAWLQQARQDLDDATFNASGKRHNVACFLAQQAAEKALKAFLYAQGIEQVRGHSVHSVEALSRQAAEFDDSLAPLTTQAAPLDQYYIPTRYPNGLPVGSIPAHCYVASDSTRARRLAGTVVEAVVSRLQPAE